MKSQVNSFDIGYCYKLICSMLACCFNSSLATPQVKLKISHHSKKNETCEVVSTKELVFVLDEPPTEAPRKRRKKGEKKESKDDGVTMKNFGANLSIPKVKNSKFLNIAWRCRLDSQGETKVLMPVRPVAVLSSMLELGACNVILM